jgi:uncharacterized membrane protein SpoIIM required for sporulation
VNALYPADTRRFRAEREEQWQRLDALIRVAEKKGANALNDEALMALPVLYRGALSALSVARETSLDLELVTYLEQLCARAYFFIYGVRTSAGSRLLRFFVQDWPAAVRSLWRETLVSFLLLLVGVIAGYAMVASNPEWFGSIIPPAMAQGRDFSASTATLAGTLRGGDSNDWLGAFATFLFTHNSQVAIMCFALGFAFGLPTALLLIQNGLSMGALIALFAARGLGLELGGWLSIHGTTELFAIVLAGAAGFRIGWAVVFPGEMSRMAAATEAGRTAALAMAGVVVMLAVAGLLEGVGRHRVTAELARYGIGGAMLLLWMAFYYLPRRARG